MSGILQAKTVRGKVAISFNNQNKTITENGIYTADKGYTGLGEVEVRVQDKGTETLASLIEGTLTDLIIPYETTQIGTSAFASKSFIKTVRGRTMPINVGYNAFNQCKGLMRVDLPDVIYLDSYAFSYCEKLADVNLPSVTTCQGSTFKCNYILENVHMPELTSISNGMFEQCYKLSSLDLQKPTSIQNSQCFAYCYSLKCLILRNTSLCTLRGTVSRVFDNCYHFFGTVNETYNPEGLKDGYIYVPRALLSDDDSTKDYRRATNWATFADRFRALEDYTVDGTITGELDESKI